MPSQNLIPSSFDDSVYRQFAKFNTICICRWDLAADSLIVPSPTPPFNLKTITANATKQLLEQDFIHPDDRPLFADFLVRLRDVTTDLTGEPQRDKLELRLKKSGGTSYIWAELKLLTYYDGSEPVVMFAIIRDINVQKEYQNSLLFKAEHDQLTKLLNKNSTEHYIKKYLSDSPQGDIPAALLIIDADNFKLINDNFGHLFGDAVLTNTAMEIERHFRVSDIFGRIGGDEFAVLIKQPPSIELITQRCQELINAVTHDYSGNGISIHYSVSVGIAIFPQHGDNYDDLMTRADTALYDAKHHIKGGYKIYEEKSDFAMAGTAEISRLENTEAVSAQVAFKDNMVNFIFRLLNENNSTDATIGIALNLLGKEFNLDRIAIDIKNPAAHTSRTAYEWLSPNGVSRKDIKDHDKQLLIEKLHNLIVSNYQQTENGWLSICQDTEKLNADEAAVCRALSLRSYAHIRIYHNRDVVGALCFETACKEREYPEVMLRYLRTFTTLLGNTLLPSPTDEYLINQNNHLEDMLNTLQGSIYVIDRNTHELLYINNRIRYRTSESISLQTCYERLMGYSQPCPDCPYLSGRKETAPDFVRNGKVYTMKVYDIDWEPGRDTVLIHTLPKQS